MPFHLKRTEPPARGVRRVCREHIRKARGCLRQVARPATVHGVRKEIKKLRAILRLVQDEQGRDTGRVMSKALRRAADRLAVPRDAQVTLAAFKKLTAPAAVRRFPQIQKALQKKCRRETRRFLSDDSVAVAGKILRKANRRVAGLKIKRAGWKAFEPGLRRGYRCGRLAFKCARREPSPDNFHAWRKQVKNFWYQLRLLCPDWPAAARAMTKKLDRLGELLGDDHDLFLLQRFVAETCAGWPEERDALNQLIESRREKLRTAALKSGTRLYAERPTVLCRRLAKDWSGWRG
jgi:CHAD domain-containing protein